MIIKGSNTVAYKCPICGVIEFKNISLFDFSGKKEYSITCACGKSFVKIITMRDNSCILSIPCIACNKTHTYAMKFKDFWINSIMKFKCDKTKIDLCFIGNDDQVRQAVDIYETQMDKLMQEIGYDDNFANSAVMLYTIDRIHDIAEKDNLLCQCGSNDIDLQILYDSVFLRCNQCSTSETIMACTNKDLKLTLGRESIILSDQHQKRQYVNKDNAYDLLKIKSSND